MLEQIALSGRAPKAIVTLHDVGETGVTLVDGVQWGDEKAYLVFGIAGAGGEHLTVLANVAHCLEDDNVIKKMRTTDDVDWLLKVLS